MPTIYDGDEGIVEGIFQTMRSGVATVATPSALSTVSLLGEEIRFSGDY